MAFNRYADDYETVITIDDKGNEKKTAVYRGPYFEMENTEKQLVLFKRLCLVLTVAIVLIHVASGFLANLGMYQFYIGLPYVIAFFPLVYLMDGILRLPNKKRKYRRDEVGFSFDQIKTSTYALLALLGICVIGEAIFIFTHSSIDTGWREILFLAFEALGTVGAFFLTRMRAQFNLKITEGSPAVQ